GATVAAMGSSYIGLGDPPGARATSSAIRRASPGNGLRDPPGNPWASTGALEWFHPVHGAFAMRPAPLALLVSLALPAAAQDSPDYALTIYSSARPGQLDSERLADYGAQLPGYAVVRDLRRLQLERGRSELRFPHVAARMDPSTVTFESLTDPDGTRVLEQNYQFDLVGRERLLERYIGETLTVEQAHGEALERTTG